jgi:putative SOS response-associated peptidase YedK
MCGRAILNASYDDLREIFGLTEIPELTPRFNIAPTQPIAIVREPGKLELLRWGLSGASARETRINVRGESVATAYRESFASRRCLVVVDGFYEWKRSRNVTRGESKPFAMRREDGKPFALAGIWARRVTPDGEVIDECAVVTGEAKGVVAEVHDRMPVMVARESHARWLTGTAKDAQGLLAPIAETLTSYEVTTRVNTPANDDAKCLEPASSEESEPRKGNLSLFD